MIKDQTIIEDAVQGVRQPALTSGKFAVLTEGQTFLSMSYAVVAGGANISKEKRIPKGMIGVVHDDTDAGAVSVIWADCQAARRARAKAALQTGKHFLMRDFDRTEDDDFKLNVAHQMNEHQEALPLYSPTNGKLVGWNIQNKYE